MLSEFVTTCLDQLLGVVAVDPQSRILFITSRLAAQAGISKPQNALGLTLEQAFPGCTLRPVLESGLPDRAQVWTVNGQPLVVSQVPIIRQGRVAGALAVSVDEGLPGALAMARQIERLAARLDCHPEAAAAPETEPVELVAAGSPAMEQVVRLIRLSARGDSTVLLLGETGTGKEVCARAIHQASIRAGGPLVTVNCAALPRDLLESELFGYEEGAFTGARRGGKPGKFELASGGTLFLDEISDLPLEFQPKLLRVLQGKQVDRLGGTRPIPVDVRLVAATNADLQALVQAGRFRADLYYRLSVVTITLPPLRERMETLPELVHSLLGRLNRKMHTRVTGLTADALALIRSYPWPGNVRELENILERVLNVVTEGEISGRDLRLLAPHLEGPGLPESAAPPATLDLRAWLRRAERTAIEQALTVAGGNRTRAAEILGIHRTVLHEKLKKYGLM